MENYSSPPTVNTNFIKAAKPTEAQLIIRACDTSDGRTRAEALSIRGNCVAFAGRDGWMDGGKRP
jgi:hypothetical protein